MKTGEVTTERHHAGPRGAQRARGIRYPPSLVVGLVLLIGLVALALAAPLFGDPLRQDISEGLGPTGQPLPPGGKYLLGTDSLGRDLVPRLAYGARVSITVAVLANVASLVIGVGIGLVAGFYRGIAESILMRGVDIALALPYVLFALALAAILPSGMTRVVVIIAALFWAYPARLFYGEVLRLRGRGFVDASVASGASGLTVVGRHVLPHLGPLILTYTPLNAASAVLAEATLSFLGAGINPPVPSWGNMISEGEGAISYAPHLLLLPGSLIFITALAFVLIGEGLKVRNPGVTRVSWLGV